MYYLSLSWILLSHLLLSPPYPFPCPPDGLIGADQDAEMAAHALIAVQNGLALFIEAQGLMAPVGAGNHTASAAQAIFPVKFRKYDAVPFQHLGAAADTVQSLAHQLLQGFHSLVVKVITQTSHTYNRRRSLKTVYLRR